MSQSAYPVTRRPQRRRVSDFAGRNISLPDNAASWRQLGTPRPDGDYLILGLGPNGCPPLQFPPHKQIRWLEESGILSAFSSSPPADWQKVTPEEAVFFARHSNIFFYSPGLRIAPEFWSGLLATLEVATSACLPKAATDLVWLPGTPSQLLHQELQSALDFLGLQCVCSIPKHNTAQSLAEAFGGCLPRLAISINFRGLDSDGRIFELCRALNIPVAIWLVDNPWNLLSGIGLPWWREAALFVTDASFLQPLHAYGARHAHFLPLAASGHMRQPVCRASMLPLFVGRSEFPRKKKFFAGVKIEENLMKKAIVSLQAGQNPDFHWWSAQCGAKLWPGFGERQPAFGTEQCSAIRRANWLAAAVQCGLRIVGDAGWQKFLPDAAVLPPADYYGSLPFLYNAAECCLNVTSLLLPQSLSQRHFDVWHAGGFLFSDATKGLEIFPQNLAEPITLENPEQFCGKLEWLRANPRKVRALKQAWQEEIRTNHLYSYRINRIMEIMAV